MTLLERLDERWERMDGAAATKIDRILKERREAMREIEVLRAALSQVRDNCHNAVYVVACVNNAIGLPPIQPHIRRV